MNVYIYDNNEISVSIVAKDQKTADKILGEHVKDPKSFSQEESIDVDDLQID